MLPKSFFYVAMGTLKIFITVVNRCTLKDVFLRCLKDVQITDI